MTSDPATLTPSLDDRKRARPMNGPTKPVPGHLPACLKPETGLDPAKPKYSGTEIKVDGEEIKILRESDILAKIVK